MKIATATAGKAHFRRKLRGTVAAVLACLVLPACVNLGAKVPEVMFRLTADEAAPAGDLASGDLSKAILVLDPETDRSLDVTRVPVRLDSASIAYLEDAWWVEKPSRQFRSILAETLRARTGALVVEGTDLSPAGGMIVGGRLLDMGYDVPSSSVIVRFDAFRGARGGAVTVRRFEATVPNVKAEAVEVGPALNRAANDVARQVADWVKAG